MSCVRGIYRGVTICEHSRLKYERLAAGIGSAYFHPIQGSYSNRVEASAGTHSGGGALDNELDGHTWATAKLCETYARDSCDLLYFIRWWVGNRHGHMLDPDCPSLPASAAAQFTLWNRGYDALVGNNADTGSRASVNRIMGRFNNRFNAPVWKPRPLPNTALPTTDWFDMATEKDLERVINARVGAIVRSELFRPEYLREQARFNFTGYAFDHDGVPETPDAVLSVALKELRIAAGASRTVLTDTLRRELALLRGLAGADIEAIISRILADLPAPPPATPPSGPGITTARGVDASGHQSVDTVRAWADDPTCDFVILKASEGKASVNASFTAQREASGDKYLGAYHFAWPNQDPAEDFANYVRVAQPKPGDVVFLDLEDWGVTDPAHPRYAQDKAMRDATPWEQRIDFAFSWMWLARDELGAVGVPYMNWTWVKAFREHARVGQWRLLVEGHPLWLADYDFGMGIHPPVDAKPDTKVGWPVILHQWTTNGNTKDENWTPDLDRLRSLGVL